MAKWASPDVLDNGPAHIRDNGNVLHVISNYSAGDSYAAVLGNSVLNYPLAAGDFSLENHGADGRKLVIFAQTGNNASGNSGASPDLHFAVVDSVNSAVLWVTDETGDQEVTAGAPWNTPALEYQQPNIV